MTTRGRLEEINSKSEYEGFQSTPPRGRRPPRFPMESPVTVFQSTPPRGRRRYTTKGHAFCCCFNPRLRAGGDLGPSSSLRSGNLFQSTPPRGRRRMLQRMVLQKIRVSIHASAREATINVYISGASDTVSIHASAREATSQPGAIL